LGVGEGDCLFEMCVYRIRSRLLEDERYAENGGKQSRSVRYINDLNESMNSELGIFNLSLCYYMPSSQTPMLLHMRSCMYFLPGNSLSLSSSGGYSLRSTVSSHGSCPRRCLEVSFLAQHTCVAPAQNGDCTRSKRQNPAKQAQDATNAFHQIRCKSC
jgi:hypothetical protein